MFYFRCGKETGRFKFFRQTDSTYGNTDRMQLLFVFTKDISILAPPKSKSRNSDVSIVCITPEKPSAASCFPLIIVMGILAAE